MTAGRVVHVKDKIPGAIYVGRAVPRAGLAGSVWRNPYRIGREGSRAACLAMYGDDLMRYPEPLERLPELRGRPLACWCRRDGDARTAENACRADILLGVLGRLTDGEVAETVAHLRARHGRGAA